MRDFKDIIKDYQNTDNKFRKNKIYKELLQNTDIKRIFNAILYEFKQFENISQEDTTHTIEFCLADILNTFNIDKCQNSNYLKITLQGKVRDHLIKNELTEEQANKYKLNKNAKAAQKRREKGQTDASKQYKPRNLVQDIDSISRPVSEDSNISLENIIPDNDDTELNNVYSEIREFTNKLIEKGITGEPGIILLSIYKLDDLDKISDLNSLVSALQNKYKGITHKKVTFALKKYVHDIPELRSIIQKIFSFSTYQLLVDYLINNSNQNSKVKIPKLIMDFNKIRRYLSIIISDEEIKDKTDIIKRVPLNSTSSYEKEINRILFVFQQKNKNIFNFRDKLKNASPEQFSRIYDIHTASNLFCNFLILDVLRKSNTTNLKLKDIIDEILPQKYELDEQKIKTFRKYTLLPRLKELGNYGFISIDNDKYSLNDKTLTYSQKKSLEYVVPFFCGLYPFASIGHFIANRLDSKKLFKFEAFNLANILDDCITYDLLSAINHNEVVTLNFKNKEHKEIKPKELIIDKTKSLIKVLDEDNEEYYLCDIDKISSDTKSNNPIFSEIYSMYYKIFEKMVIEYKQHNLELDKIIEQYNIYTSEKDKACFNNIAKELVPLLSKLKDISIPLTKLELQWLKTIMQDARFDLFVSEKEKNELEDLLKDVDPFDLTSFKIFNKKKEKYVKLTDTANLEVINIDLVRENLKEANKILFSPENNSFKFEQ